MNDERTIEDRLRQEYFELLPDIRSVADHLEAEVRYCLLPIYRKLASTTEGRMILSLDVGNNARTTAKRLAESAEGV